MTRMSDVHSVVAAPIDDNRPKLLARSALARRVQRFLAAVLGLALFVLVSCVPSLSVEKQDAGQNSPPGIVKVIADGPAILDEAQTVTFAKGKGTLTLQLIDTDLGDTLFVRVYVNYSPQNPTPPRATCTAPPNKLAQRDDTTCSLIALCQDTDLGAIEDMTVVVFDRAVNDNIPPVFQYDGPDGLSASQYYHLKCVAGT
jgi:hypothetical protein